MKYYSTKRQSESVSLREAVINCVSPDGGLYLPAKYPIMPKAFINNMPDMTLREIAYVTSNLFLGEDMDSAIIKQIVDDTFTFDVPLIKLSTNRYILELFHGPSEAFKDLGALFLAHVIKALNSRDEKKLNIIASSTGNTGVAVANAFGGLDNTNVYILYPHDILRNECLTVNNFNNVNIIDVAGNIEDCKAMIAELFADSKLREQMYFTSANSINIARLMPQMAVLYYACSRLKKSSVNPADTFLSLPSGNMSLLTSAMMAKNTGLQSKRFIAACNSNNGFTELFNGHSTESRQTVKTLARFIDMATPSNLDRIMDLCHNNPQELDESISSIAVSDDDIIKTIGDTYKDYKYICDPHTAVGLNALDSIAGKNSTGLVFATAAPIKSKSIIENILNINIGENSNCKTTRSCHISRISPTYPALKKLILNT